MKKRVLVSILVAAMVTGAISGCGKKDEKNPEQAVESSDEAALEESAKDDTTQEPSADAGSDETSLDVFTVKTHHLECEKDGKVEAIGTYPEIVLPEGYATQFPKLKEAVDVQNSDWASNVKEYVNMYAGYEKMDFQKDVAFESDVAVDIVRADEKLFSLLVYSYDESGGAHPNHYTSSINLDPASGEKVALVEVLGDVKKTPEILKNALYKAYPDMVDEFESMIYTEDGEDTTGAFARKLDNDEFTWSLKSEGLHIYYSPYEVASYAAGEFETILSQEKYPDLIESYYMPATDLDMNKQVNVKDLEKEKFQWEDSDFNPYESDSDAGAGVITVQNKSWNAFTEDGRGPDDGEHIKITKVSEKKTDWLDTYKWATEHDFEVANMPYTDDEYYYEGASPVEYEYMSSELIVHDKDYTKVIYDLDLYTLCNGPDEETNTYSRATQYVRWAKIYDGTLYVSLMQSGYASEEPNSSYMVAIAPDTGDVLWRSEPLVANADNFVIVKDTIICGYGFTAEPDFIYLLDRFTGQIMDKIPVNSGPDQFEVVGDKLYVATYNTEYEFKIE